MITSLTINGHLIWDWSKVIPLLVCDKIEYSDDDISPIGIDDKYVELCRIKLNIHSLIHNEANFKDIMNVWNSLEKIMDMPRIAEFLIFTTLSRIKDTNITTENLWRVEPLIIVLLRFCYWYSQILKLPSVKHKQQEIKQRLGKKLLRRLKNHALQTIPIEDIISDEQLKKEIDDEARKRLYESGSSKEHLEFESGILGWLIDILKGGWKPKEIIKN